MHKNIPMYDNNYSLLHFDMISNADDLNAVYYAEAPLFLNPPTPTHSTSRYQVGILGSQFIGFYVKKNFSMR